MSVAQPVDVTLECSDSCSHLNDQLSSLTLKESEARRLQQEELEEDLTEGSDSMPLRRRRASPSTDDQRAKRARASSKRPGSRDSDSFTSKRCISWFHEYTGPDDDCILPEGMEKLCEDIGVKPENIVMLALAFKLDARNMGFFTLSEWLKGMTELGCDNITKLQNKLDYLRNLLDDSIVFKNIYRYAFDFARDKDQRSMDIDLAKAMLQLLFGKNWSLCGSFLQFLEQSKYKVINKDQWCNVLEFSRTIKPDLSNYDEDGAWPVMLDEYVEWTREQNRLDHQMS